MFRDGLELKIVCFIPELMDQIQKHISAFFLINNFGTREDKGFGSFIVNEKDGGNLTDLLKKYGKTEGYQVYYVDTSKCSDRNDLDNAYVLYQWMKSGINFRSTYKKSLLTEYMLNKKIGGEKRWMKQEGIAPKVMTDPHNKKAKTADSRPEAGEVSELKYIRAVLGVSGTQSWVTDIEDGFNRNGDVKYKKQEIGVSSTEVERFQSPITIKYISNKIYFLVYDLNSEPRNKVFNQSFKFKNSDTKKEGELRTVSDFDIEDFMVFCAEKIKGQSFVFGKDKNKNDLRYCFNLEKLMTGGAN